MGILDSNTRQVYSSISAVNIFANQTDVIAVGTNKIDCAKYNTLILEISSTSETGVALYGYYSTGVSNPTITGFDVKTLNETTFPLRPYNGYKQLIVDVSLFSTFSMGKLDANGSLTIKGTLTADSYGFTLQNTKSANRILESIRDKDIPVSKTIATDQPTGAWVIKSEFAKTTLVKVNATGEILIWSLKTQSGTVKTDMYGLVYDLSTDFHIRQQCKLPAGEHLLLFDSSASAELYIGINSVDSSTGKVSISYTVHDLLFNDWLKDRKNRYLYRYNQTESKGKDDYIYIDKSFKRGIICCNVPENTMSNFSAYAVPTGFFKKGANDPSPFAIEISRSHIISSQGFITKTIPIWVKSGITSYYFDCNSIDAISFAVQTPTNGITIWVEYSNEEFSSEEKRKLSRKDSAFDSTEIIQIAETENYSLHYWDQEKTGLRLGAAFRDIAVWYNNEKLELSTSGVTGERKSVDFNSINFPDLIVDSKIERILLMPWSRNAQTSKQLTGFYWRMNVITNKGQIYHNFPSRANSSDGLVANGDELKFDESVIWDKPDRWHPVKTKGGNDLALINTKCYRYFPCLPEISYEFHPAINKSNGYGNNGFEAVLSKQKENGEWINMPRFWQPLRTDAQDCSFIYMGGFAPNEKLTLLGTYLGNDDKASRICTFGTNDGGRQWFVMYEFGDQAYAIYPDDSKAHDPFLNFGADLSFNGTVGSGAYTVSNRKHYVPNETNKEVEKTKKFKFEAGKPVLSIQGGSTIIVTTETAHGYKNGEIVVFNKLNGNNDWDWIVNEGYSNMSAGNGVMFKIKVLSDTSFQLTASVHDPNNNYACRHIHGINYCADGFIMGSGEVYPTGGWMFWYEMRDQDSYGIRNPWDGEFIRLNSTSKSIQRLLGAVLTKDANNTILFGSDEAKIDMGETSITNGRTDVFKRGSSGLWRGTLNNVDDMTKYECIYPSKEVCYLFKEALGVLIYIGQLKEIGLSFDNGTTWSQSKLPTSIVGVVEHLTGITNNREIVIDNLLIKLKK